MSVRQFNKGSKDWLRFSIGSNNISGAITMAVLVDITAQEVAGVSCLLGLHTSEAKGKGYLLWVNEGKLSLYNGASTVPSTIEVGTAEGPLLLAVTKASGAAKPKFYKYKFSTETWTIVEGGSTLANASAVASGTVRINEWEAAEYSTMKVFGALLDNAANTEATVKSLQAAASIEGWKSIEGPTGAWKLDQTVVTEEVVDMTGNGANQSARSGTEAVAGSPPIPFTPSTATALPMVI